MTPKSQFDAEEALLSTALAEIKAAPLKHCLGRPGLNELMLWRIGRILRYESKLGYRLGYRARENFHDLYLPEFKRVVQFSWHDPLFFTSPDEEFEAVSASSRRASEQMSLAYPENFTFSCLVRGPTDDDSGIYSHHDFSCINPAHMVMHFVDETDPRIRRSMVHQILLGQNPPYNSTNTMALPRNFVGRGPAGGRILVAIRAN